MTKYITKYDIYVPNSMENCPSFKCKLVDPTQTLTQTEILIFKKMYSILFRNT